MSDDLLTRSAEELFARHCPPAAVRAIRRGGSRGALWEAVEAAGFHDALVPEAAGGAGLTPSEALPVLLACGHFAVPLPIGDTMLARAALAAVGQTPPPGPVVLAEALSGGLRGRVPLPHDGWALLAGPDGARLLPLREAVVEGASPPATSPPDLPPFGTSSPGPVLRWPDTPDAPTLPGVGWRIAGAWVEAVEMAGAMQRILEDTVRHARDRQQFGRPVAAFQAVQQQMSVLCEDVFAARIAVQLASVADGTGPCGLDTARVAAAKARVGEAAVRVAAIAHAVQGAMGITEEANLHLLTGRLHRGRARFGSEAYWTAWLGRTFLAGNAADCLGFVRDRLGPVGEARP